MSVASLSLWAFVIALGIQTGAGIYETRVLVPLWSADPPRSLRDFHAQALRPDSGKRLWIFLSPLTTLITILNLVLALMSDAPWRGWWLAAAACSLAVMAATFAYFVPALLHLQRVAAQPAETTTAIIRRWVVLNYVRAAAIVAAWLMALRVFAEAA